MNSWLCIVLGKNLCSQGEAAARHEISRLMGEAFVDFRMPEVDEFGDDCYAFVKCKVDVPFMEKLRRSSLVIAVLDSYESPTYLADYEVLGFVQEEEGSPECLSYGDIVNVEGEGPYVNLQGVVVIPGCTEAQVLFRFHTKSNRVWFGNTELCRVGSVFQYLKFPATDNKLIQEDKKHPYTREAHSVSTSKSNWGAYRQGESDEKS